jgi:hypothetical protein
MVLARMGIEVKPWRWGIPPTSKENCDDTLRQRMADAMLQPGFAASTRANYVKAIYGMAKYYRRDPAGYSANEVQAYLLHMVKDRHVSFSSMNQTASAVRFLYETVLGHDREQFHIPMAKVPVTQPELLSREEIARLFAACSNPVYRMILQTPSTQQGCACLRPARCGCETLTARLTACVFASRMKKEINMAPLP